MTRYSRTMSEAYASMYPIDEATMSSSQIARLKKAYEPMRDKKISTSNANKLSAMMDKVGKDKEALIQLFKADIPFVSQSAVTQLITKHDMKGAEINKLREEVDLDEEVSVKDFDALKKGDTVTVEYKSAMSSGKATFKVTAKNVVGKARVEKVTLKSTKNPAGVKHFLYKRNNKVSFAQGDMGASVVSFKKEEVDLGEVYQVYVKSPTAKSGWIAQGQPHKTEASAKKDAKNAGGVTKIVKEEVDLDEVDRSTYSDRIKRFTGFLKDAEKEKPLDKEWIKLLKRRIEKENADMRKELKLNREEVDLDENLNQMKKHIDDLEFERKRMTTSGQLYLDKLIKAKSIKDARKAFEDMYEDGNFKRITSSGQESMVKIGKMLGMKIVEEVDLDEGFSPKEIKMAIGIASDKRYAGGNMTGAVAAIDKIKKGLSDHPQVAAVLRRQNEEDELDEGKMSQLHQYIKDKKSPEEIAKMMKLDVKTIKSLMSEIEPDDEEEEIKEGKPGLWDNIHKKRKSGRPMRKPGEKGAPTDQDFKDSQEGAAADARRAMSKDKDLRRGKDSADDDDSATDDDVKAASKNIMMQLRKSISLKGRFDVEFGDKKKTKIPAAMAQAVTQKYNSLKKPVDKEKFQAKIAKSYKDMLKTMKEGFKPSETILERMNRKLRENKNG